ncbi:MAG: Gfo/Idh/MocA family oxidoreductase [Devosia sp.]
MQALSIAVIGVGSFGQHHVRHLSAHPSVGSVLVIDSDRARARSVAAQHGATFADRFDPSAVDAVVICTPTESHFALAMAALSAGRAVFVEKPLAASVEEADRLIAAASASGALLQVGHIERFSPVVRALQSATGSAIHIAATRHNKPRPVPPSADVVLDLMIHDIDLAITLAGSGVTRVEPLAFAGAANWSEAASARLWFRNGVIADLSASRLAPTTMRSLTVHDAHAVHHADLVERTLTTLPFGSDMPAHFAPQSIDHLAAELDAFIRAVATNGPAMVDGHAGRSALAVAEQVRSVLMANASPLLQLTA